MEIDELLIELDSVTDRMALFAETSHSATVAHTLTRHRDILQGLKLALEKIINLKDLMHKKFPLFENHPHYSCLTFPCGSNAGIHLSVSREFDVLGP